VPSFILVASCNYFMIICLTKLFELTRTPIIQYSLAYFAECVNPRIGKFTNAVKFILDLL